MVFSRYLGVVRRAGWTAAPWMGITAGLAAFVCAFVLLGASPAQAACTLTNARAEINQQALDAGLRALEAGNDAEARDVWGRAAAAGDRLAQHNLATLLMSGNTEGDLTEAACWLLNAAKQGFAPAENDLGTLYHRGLGTDRDFVKAAMLYESAAKQGLPSAERHLALLLEEGLGVPRDPERAFRLMLSAAEKGHPQAARSLGLMYDAGNGVQRDFDKAVEWTKTAIDRGDPQAISNLGWFFYRDQGQGRDVARGVELYRQSAAAGSYLGQYNLGIAYATGVGAEVDLARAIDLFRQSAAQGHGPAMNRLGHSYLNGIGVERSPQKALDWFLKARAEGDNTAINNIGIVYRDGLGVPRSPYKAVDYFREAANQGHIASWLNLGDLYSKGVRNGTPVDAFEAYREAARAGNAAAQARLASLYEKGQGTGKSLERAWMWSFLAAQGSTGQAAQDSSATEKRAKLIASRSAKRLKEMLRPDVQARAEATAELFRPKVRHGLYHARGNAVPVGVVSDPLLFAAPAPVIEQPLSERLLQPLAEQTEQLVEAAPQTFDVTQVRALPQMLTRVSLTESDDDRHRRCRLINELKSYLGQADDCQLTQSVLDGLRNRLASNSRKAYAGKGDSAVPRSYALLVAVEDYAAPFGKRSWPDLRYPVADMDRLAGILRNNFGFEVMVLKNPRNKEEVEEVFWDLLNSDVPMDQFLLVWAGHGTYSAFKNQGYLALAGSPMNEQAESAPGFLKDAEGDPYYRDYLSYNEIHGFLSGLKADKLFLADACQSGLAAIDTGAIRTAVAERGIQVESLRGNFSIGMTSGNDRGSPVPDASAFMETVITYLDEVNRAGVEGNARGLWGSLKRSLARIRASAPEVPLPHRYEIPGHVETATSDFRFLPVSAVQISRQ